MPVRLSRQDGLITVVADSDGNFHWSSDRASLLWKIREIVREKGWTHGRFLSDELFVARLVAAVLGDCKLPDEEGIVGELREGWIRLLRENLLPDPATAYGQRLDSLRRWEGLSCVIGARPSKLSVKPGYGKNHSWPVTGEVNVGDPRWLRFGSRVGNTADKSRDVVRRLAWDYIVGMGFVFKSPMPDLVVQSRAEVAKLVTIRDGKFD